MQRRTISWIDAASNERETRLTSSAGAPLTMAALQALSRASVINWFEGVIVVAAHSGPVPLDFPSVGNMVAFDCGTLSGDENRIFLPAPLSTIFLADLQTVDMTNALVLGIGTAAALELENPLTNNAVLVVRNGYGFRRSAPIRESLVIGNNSAAWGDTLVWVDADGRTTATRLVSASGAPNTAAALEAASNAVILQTWGGVVTVLSPPTPSTSPYSSALDSCNILAVDAGGRQTSIILPAPYRSAFLADGATLDPGNAGVATLFGAILSELVAPGSGGALTQVIGGRLVRGNQSGVK